jgi:hypothetical protein
MKALEKSEGKVVKFLATKDSIFTKACELAGIPPTRRQASKWLAGKGVAYRTYKSGR